MAGDRAAPAAPAEGGLPGTAAVSLAANLLLFQE
jgi:hypothetical protein